MPAVDDSGADTGADGAAATGWADLRRGYRLAGLLISADRLGVLRQLADAGSTTVADLAADVIADPVVVEWLCRGLWAAGYVERVEDGWRLTPQGIALATTPGAVAELDALARDYERFGRLDACARALAVGDAPERDEPASGTAAARRAALREAVRHHAEHDALLARLRPLRPVEVLDVGGADGAFARRVVARWPQARVTVLEAPDMAAIAREACAGHDRIEVRGGRFLDADDPHPLPDGTDVVVLSHVLQGLPPAHQRRLVARAAHALADGGCIVSCESVLRVDERGPIDVVLWALGEAASGSLGAVLTVHAQDALLRAAGLAAAGAWPAGPGNRAVLAVRPDAGAVPALELVDAGHDPLDGENRAANSARALRSVSPTR